jgi:glycosyltransferase involved in cell wall biosynthesis
MKKVLILYSETAPYLMACVEQAVADHGITVDIVRWPVNKEAPFRTDRKNGITIHGRETLTTEALRRLAREVQPDVVLCSGWVDKAYLRVCRDMRRRGIPTVMCSDPAWHGTLRQRVAVAVAPFWLLRTFTHAWVPGERQAEYARRLGFPDRRIKRGFYSADLALFAPLAERFRPAKAEHYPHRILSVARYLTIKGHPYMEEAFAELCDEGGAGDWELWCIGTGDLYPSRLQHPRVRHIGFVQAEGIQEYMAQCGVFVLASLYEAWGVAVHEHAAAGFPLLLSDAVGARQRFLQEGRTGWGFKPGDKESLKAAYRKAIATPDAELLAMGMRSAELARAWGPKQWAGVLMELIGEGHG